MNYNYGMMVFNFDLTRRCNLQCPFCSRGKAEDQDITPEIINAALDQIKDNNVYISHLRLSGGEPFLAVDQIEYIVDQIIKRQMKIRNCTIFTNGIIKDKRALEALIKLAEYLSSISDMDLYTEFENNLEDKYTYRDNEKVSIIISEEHHDNKEYLMDTIDFYSNKHPNMYVELQSSKFKHWNRESLMLEGLAIDNIKSLISNITTIRANDNRYNFINWNPDYKTPDIAKWFFKAITVSTNGKVFPGCLRSYNRVDQSDCNVLSDNIFKYFESYCWQHPITMHMGELRRLIKARKILKENNINTPEYTDLDVSTSELIDMFERLAITLHQEYPDLSPHKIQIMAGIKQCHIMSTVKNDPNAIRAYVENVYVGLFTPNQMTLLTTFDGRLKIANDLQQTIDLENKKRILAICANCFQFANLT